MIDLNGYFTIEFDTGFFNKREENIRNLPEGNIDLKFSESDNCLTVYEIIREWIELIKIEKRRKENGKERKVIRG